PEDADEEAAEREAHAKQRQCARIYARYQQRLTDLRLLDPEGRLRHAADLLARGMLRPFDCVRAVFVDDFVSLTKVQHDILAALGGVCEELWVALLDEDGEERAELFTVSRATLQRLQRLQPEASGERESPGTSTDRRTDPPRSPGLVHLERHLFRPLRGSRSADNATGVLCIQAPGVLGEARMVARHGKSLLREGVPAQAILIT